MCTRNQQHRKRTGRCRSGRSSHLGRLSQANTGPHGRAARVSLQLCDAWAKDIVEAGHHPRAGGVVSRWSTISTRYRPAICCRLDLVCEPSCPRGHVGFSGSHWLT
jgi:hypothetical protein